jgi:tetratricopeptide (TPR) repeat protein
MQSISMKTGLGIAAAAVAALLAASCATLGEEDAARGAPQIDGLGRSTFPVTARDEETKALFHSGLLLAYAFEHQEAARAFRAAAARDASCAMCAWGVAWALGPNINQAERRNVREIRRYVALAQSAAPGTTPLEQALIRAMSVRYRSADGATQKASEAIAASMCTTSREERDFDPLDLAYAQEMTAVLQRYPTDPDVVTLYADAVMMTSPWDWWDLKTGAPNGSMAEVVQQLQAAAARSPDHTGLLHFQIHATEQSPTPEVAAAGADRLGTLAPGAPHLVHMPAHTYVQTGRFEDAVAVNRQALRAQQAFDRQITSQGFQPLNNWDFHHLHFLWYASLSSGQGEQALATAREMASRFGSSTADDREYARSLPFVTLVRLQRWDEILALTAPAEGLGLAEGIRHYARGVAHARTGRPAEARIEAAALQRMRELPTLQGARIFDLPIPADMLEQSASSLAGEIALAEGRHADAINSMRRASELDDELGGEPPRFAAGARLDLARALRAAGELAEAESELQKYLKRHRDSGWALLELQETLRQQGRKADAQAALNSLSAAWKDADSEVRRLAQRG